ncbi:hypothetical protein [Clostridium sp. DL1XJH146]
MEHSNTPTKVKRKKVKKKVKNKKPVIIITSILSVLTLTILILFILVTSGGKTLIFEVNSSSNLISEVVSLSKTGGELEISSKDINGVLDSFVVSGALPETDNISIESILCTMTEDIFSLYIPTKINNIEVLLNCTGTLSYNNDNFKFTPNSFKLGKLKLPTDFVIKKISPYLKNKISLEENSIIIPKDALPIDIDSVEIKNGKIIASIEKIIVEDIEEDSETENSENTSQENTTEKTEQAGPTKEELRQAQLRQTASDLSRVYNAVKTDAEKSIVSTMKSVVNSMIKDPNFDYQSSSASVKSKYNALSPDEKSDIKNAILFNMGTDSLRSLNNTFHLI